MNNGQNGSSSEFLRPEFFAGDWEILAKKSKDHKRNTPQRVTITLNQFSVDNGHTRSTFLVETMAATGEAQSIDTCTLSDEGTLISDNSTLCVSYWRRPFYDVIFALDQDRDGVPVTIWTAKRSGRPPKPPAISGRTWHIKMHKGRTAATGIVELKKLRKMEIFQALPKKIKKQLRSNSIWEHGYGLLHRCSCDSEPELYDIVAYDAGVKSFNSIFGFRSFNYVESYVKQRQRVFATFDSEFLRLTRDRFDLNGRLRSTPTNLLIDLCCSHPQFQQLWQQPKAAQLFRGRLFSDTKIGFPMSFEELPDDDDDDDPDIGVWVGLPDPD